MDISGKRGEIMSKKMYYLLNTPILTEYGTFKFSRIETVDAVRLLKTDGFKSAIGHESTAKLLSKLWDMDIPVNRNQIRMWIGDRAIVFRLLTRLPEGKVLNEEELSKISYELGLLERVD